MWNRQRTDKDLADPADVSLGQRDLQRWNLPDGWVISKRPAHEALGANLLWDGNQAESDSSDFRRSGPWEFKSGPGCGTVKGAINRTEQAFPYRGVQIIISGAPMAAQVGCRKGGNGLPGHPVIEG